MDLFTTVFRAFGGKPQTLQHTFTPGPDMPDFLPMKPRVWYKTEGGEYIYNPDPSAVGGTKFRRYSAPTISTRVPGEIEYDINTGKSGVSGIMSVVGVVVVSPEGIPPMPSNVAGGVVTDAVNVTQIGSSGPLTLKMVDLSKHEEITKNIGELKAFGIDTSAIKVPECPKPAVILSGVTMFYSEIDHDHGLELTPVTDSNRTQFNMRNEHNIYVSVAELRACGVCIEGLHR